jgi:hypothetical protein
MSTSNDFAIDATKLPSYGDPAQTQYTIENDIRWEEYLSGEEVSENAEIWSDTGQEPSASDLQTEGGGDVFDQIAAQNGNDADNSNGGGGFSTLESIFGTSVGGANSSADLQGAGVSVMGIVENAAKFLGVDASPFIQKFNDLVSGGATKQEALHAIAEFAPQVLPQETASKVQNLINVVAQSDGDLTQAAIAGTANLLGFSTEQAGAVQGLVQQITSGESVDWSSVAQLVGKTGLISEDLGSNLSNALQSIQNKDYGGAVGAISGAMGLDGAAVQQMLAADSSLEDRAAAALQLGLGVNVSPEAIEQAVQGVQEGNFTGALNLLASATGDETVGKIAQGAQIVQQAVALSDSGSATAQDWVSLGQSAASMLGLSDKAQNAIGAIPEVMEAYQAIASGKEFDYGSAGATALKLAGLDEQTANALGDSADTILDAIQSGGKNLNVSSVAGAIATVSGALGAPQEVTAVATALQGALAGGVSGYGAIASAVGQIIGGETGAVIGKIGAYAACAASGPVGWAAGAVMLTMDLFSVQPPRESLIPTQNTAFLAQDENGNQTVRVASQTGGQDEMSVGVSELRREDIVQRPEFLREPIESRFALHGTDPGGATLVDGDILYSDVDQDGISDARVMMDPAQGGFIVQEGEEKFVENPNGTEVKLEKIDWQEFGPRDSDGNRNKAKSEPPSGDDIVKKSDGDGGFDYYREVKGSYQTEWTTTARFADGAPQGSALTVNQESGQLEVWAKADSVFTGLSGEQAQSGYVKYWESTRGSAPAEGKQAILQVTDGGNLQTAEQALDGSGYNELETFTSESDGGFFGLGASYTDDDQGKLAGRPMEIDDPDGKLDNMGFLDKAEQLAQLIERTTATGATVTDIQMESEGGDEVVLYDKGDGSYLALDREDYDERVRAEAAVVTLPPALQPQEQTASAEQEQEQDSNAPVTFANAATFTNASSYELFDDDVFADDAVNETNRQSDIEDDVLQQWNPQNDYEFSPGDYAVFQGED